MNKAIVFYSFSLTPRFLRQVQLQAIAIFALMSFLCAQMPNPLSWQQEDGWQPFTPELLRDPRLAAKRQHYVDQYLVIVLPPENKSQLSQYDWLADTFAKTIARKLQQLNTLAIPGKPYLSQEVVLAHSDYQKQPLVNLRRYLQADRRDSLARILEKEQQADLDASKSQGSQSLATGAYANSETDKNFTVSIFYKWQQFVAQSMDTNRSKKRDYNWTDEDREVFDPLAGLSWQQKMDRLNHALVQEMKMLPVGLQRHILFLGGDYSILNTGEHENPKQGRQDWNPEGQDVNLSFFFYNTYDNKISWQKQKIVNIKGDWQALFEFSEQIKRQFEGDYGCRLDLSQISPEFLVYVDGHYYGRSPMIITSLKPGYRHLLLYKDEDQKSRTWLQMQQNKNIVVVEQPQKKNYNNSIRISGTENSQIYLDGIPIGNIPVEHNSIPPGYHRLRFSKKGYYDFERYVHIEKDKVHTYDIDMRPLPEIDLQETNKKPLWREFGGSDGNYFTQAPNDYQIVKPYRWLNFFENGNDLEIGSKYLLALSVLAFTGALVSDGSGKRKIDRETVPDPQAKNPYRPYTISLLSLGSISLLGSGTLLYFSLIEDDASFASRSWQGNFSILTSQNDFGLANDMITKSLTQPGGYSEFIFQANFALRF